MKKALLLLLMPVIAIVIATAQDAPRPRMNLRRNPERNIRLHPTRSPPPVIRVTLRGPPAPMPRLKTGFHPQCFAHFPIFWTTRTWFRESPKANG